MHKPATEGAPGQPEAIHLPLCNRKVPAPIRRHKEIIARETARDGCVVCFRLIGGVLSMLLLHKLANACLSEQI